MEDEFVALVTRSIFDKKEFQKGYIKRIDELINVNDVITKFQLFFLVYFCDVKWLTRQHILVFRKEVALSN